jgi:hypothetical protein
MHALAHWCIVFGGVFMRALATPIQIGRLHWQFSSERVYSLLANHTQEPAALAKLSKSVSVSHANAVRCRIEYLTNPRKYRHFDHHHQHHSFE